MTDRQRKSIEMLGLKTDDFKPKPKPTELHISREDFDLLDYSDKDILYYITEEDGTVTIRKGEE